MSAEVMAVRCGHCHDEYRMDRDMISGRFMWMKPKAKRAKGSCQHAAKPEVLVEHPDGGAHWVEAA